MEIGRCLLVLTRGVIVSQANAIHGSRLHVEGLCDVRPVHGRLVSVVLLRICLVDAGCLALAGDHRGHLNNTNLNIKLKN